MGAIIQMYHGAPPRDKTVRTIASTEIPRMLHANRTAQVRLRPRSARQDHVTAEIGFTASFKPPRGPSSKRLHRSSSAGSWGHVPPA